MSASAEPRPDPLRRALEAVLGASQVSLSLDRFGRHSLVVAPGSAAEVAEVVRLVGAAGAALVPLGAGMRDIPAIEASRLQVLVDLQRLRHVLRLDETSLVVEVQAGLKAIELEHILARRNLSLGDYPPSSLTSSIGGLLAVRTPGKMSRRHGFIEDAVIGLSAVLADGRTVHTRVSPRRATGPDLARALCGSEGTLGVITSAVLRIHRRPEARLLAAHAMPSFDDALSAVHLALREEAAPSALRVYDREGARLHFGDLAEDAESLLLVATAGPTDLAACDRDLVASAATAVGGKPADPAVAQTWWNARFGAEPAPAAPHLQVSATPRAQRAVVAATRSALAATGVTLATYASRFDFDGAVLFFILLGEEGRPLTGADLANATNRALEAAREAGAYLLAGTSSDLQDYFRDLRDRLDPAHVLNPGTLTGGTESAR